MQADHVGTALFFTQAWELDVPLCEYMLECAKDRADTCTSILRTGIDQTQSWQDL